MSTCKTRTRLLLMYATITRVRSGILEVRSPLTQIPFGRNWRCFLVYWLESRLPKTHLLRSIVPAVFVVRKPARGYHTKGIAMCVIYGVELSATHMRCAAAGSQTCFEAVILYSTAGSLSGWGNSQLLFANGAAIRGPTNIHTVRFLCAIHSFFRARSASRRTGSTVRAAAASSGVCRGGGSAAMRVYTTSILKRPHTVNHAFARSRFDCLRPCYVTSARNGSDEKLYFSKHLTKTTPTTCMIVRLS